MNAAVLERYGKKRALRLAEAPNPELRGDEVLVEVHAAGVQGADVVELVRFRGQFSALAP